MIDLVKSEELESLIREDDKKVNRLEEKLVKLSEKELELQLKVLY